MTRDMTPTGRCTRAEAVVREQRDPNGEYGGVGHPILGPTAEGGSIVEAFYLQELERLQRAVMGEAE